jgi:HK97 family phage portal protein
MLNGHMPVFSQFGQDIYASDIVQKCVDAIATELSKLRPQHIRTDANSGMQTIPRNTLNQRLFKFKPNPLMTTRDLLEKTIWQLYKNHNAFIYPMFEPAGEGRINYTALYPLTPISVTFLQDPANELFIKLEFAGGKNVTLPYASIIHIRKKYSDNEFMGGGVNGQPDNRALLKILEVNDIVLQGLPKAIKTSLGIRGILKINTVIDGEKQQAERERFEEMINRGETGVLPVDLKGDYTDLRVDPKVIDQATMLFIKENICDWYGVPIKILAGEFTDDDYQAWYERTLESVIVSLGQAFTGAMFSDREIDVGNEIVFYHRDMMYLSTKSKLELLKTTGEQGLLTDNEKLAILGYPPLADGTGNRRTISLNYVSTDISDQYQLGRANAPRIDPATE